MGIIPDGDHEPMSEDMAKSLLGILMLEMQDKNLKTAKEILKGIFRRRGRSLSFSCSRKED